MNRGTGVPAADDRNRVRGRDGRGDPPASHRERFNLEAS